MDEEHDPAEWIEWKKDQTVEEFMEVLKQDQKKRIDALPFSKRIKAKVWPLPYRYRLIRRLKNAFEERTHAYSCKCLLQRAVNGFGETDHWNGDSYFARVIAGVTARLAKDNFGAPGIIYNSNGKVLHTHNWEQEESDETKANNKDHYVIWNDTLLEISEGFARYNDMTYGFDKIVDGKKVYCGWDTPEVKELKKKFKRAMGLFHHNFGSFWD